MKVPRNSPRPLVLASLENGDGTRCVDIFRRGDGTHGFEEYRRDPEDLRGWSGATGYGARVFGKEKEVRDAAETAVLWLSRDRSP